MQGVEAEVRLVASWPAGADVVQVGGRGTCWGWGLGERWMRGSGPLGLTYKPSCLLHTPWQVVKVTGAADSGKAEKAAQLRFEGRSLAAVLEAVERELA